MPSFYKNIKLLKEIIEKNNKRNKKYKIGKNCFVFKSEEDFISLMERNKSIRFKFQEIFVYIKYNFPILKIKYEVILFLYNICICLKNEELVEGFNKRVIDLLKENPKLLENEGNVQLLFNKIITDFYIHIRIDKIVENLAIISPIFIYKYKVIIKNYEKRNEFNFKIINKASRILNSKKVEILDKKEFSTKVFYPKDLKDDNESYINKFKDNKVKFRIIEFSRIMKFLKENKSNRSFLIKIEPDILQVYLRIIFHLIRENRLTHSKFMIYYLKYNNLRITDKGEIINLVSLQLQFFHIILDNNHLLIEKNKEIIEPRGKMYFEEYIIFKINNERIFIKEIILKVDLSENIDVFLARDIKKLSQTKLIFPLNLENYLNKPKVSINQNYLNFLEDNLLNSPENYIKFVHSNVTDEKQMKVIISTEFLKVKEYIVIIKKDLSFFRRCCFKHKRDHRGRIYTLRSPFTYIGLKFLLPLFDLKGYSIKDTENIQIYSVKIFNDVFEENFKDYYRVVKFSKGLDYNKIISLKNESKWYIIYFKLNNNINHVEIDCKCSGFQHISALFKNEKIIRLVGLIENNEERDFYTYILNGIIVNLKIRNNDLYLKLESKNLIKRGLVKKPTITYIYGASNWGMARYFEAFILDSDAKNKEFFSFKECIILVQCFVITFNELHLPIKEINSALGKLFYYREEKPVIFNNTFENNYFKRIHLKFRKVINNEKHHYNLILPCNIVDKRKYIKTSLVNFIHMEDSVFIKNIIIRDTRKNTLSIHDCLIVLPSDIDFFRKLSKEIFLEIYRGDVIEDFLNSIKFNKNLKEYDEIIVSKEYLIKLIGKGKINPQDICFSIKFK